MQPDVLPGGEPRGVAQAERLAGTVRFDRQRAQHVGHFPRLDAAVERDRAEMVAMQPVRQLAQHRMPGIGGDAFDHQLVARDTEGHGGAVLEQALRPRRTSRSTAGSSDG